MKVAVGPVLLRELIDHLRTRRAFLALLLFNAAVGAVVVLAWRWAEGSSHLGRSAVGLRLLTSIAFAEVAMITLLAPALSGGAITLERERGTLDLLRTTPIPTQRLLLEKFLAAVAFFVILILTSSPLLALSLILRPEALDIIGLLITLMVLIAASGAVGVAVSTAFLRTHASISVTYIVLLPIGALFGAALLGWGPQGLAVAAMGMGFIGAGVGLALWSISGRLLEAREDVEVEPESLEDVAVHAGLLLDRRVFPDRIVWPPRRNQPIPEGANPVLEKDLRLEAPGRSGRMISILIQGGMYLSLPVLIVPTMWGLRSGPTIPPIQPLIYPFYLMTFVMLITSAFSSTAFSGERERKTLDLLAATPLPAVRVVWAKAIAALRGSLGITLLLAFPYLLFFAVQYLHRDPMALLRMPIYLAVLLVTAVLITFTGLWLSLRTRTSLRAMLTTYALVAIIGILPLVAFGLIEPFTGLEYTSFRWIAVPSPVAAIISGGASLGGPELIHLDPSGSVPIWLQFFVFWGVLLPVIVGGSIREYRRYPRD